LRWKLLDSKVGNLSPCDLWCRVGNLIRVDECQAYSIPNVPVLDSVLQDVFSRSWFSRLWTIQEVALSRNAVMLCGATEIPFFTFVQGSRTISVKENRPWAENPLVGQGILGGSVALHMRMSEALDKYPSRWHKVLNKAVRVFSIMMSGGFLVNCRSGWDGS